jgi:hypothetical protein
VSAQGCNVQSRRWRRQRVSEVVADLAGELLGERERVCGHVGPGTGEACGLSPLTSVGPPPVDGSYLNFCRLLWPIEVKIISVGWLWQ